MMKNIKLTPAKLKRVGEALRNAPLFVLAGAVSIAIEMFAAGGIFAENTATFVILGFTVRMAVAEAVMSISFSLAALVLAGAAAAQKADPRPDQRRRAGATQVLALLVLAAPVYYAGNALALNRQTAEWREYHGSAAEQADLAMAHDTANVDSMVRQEAALRLRRGIKPERAEFDPASTAWIAFLLYCNMLAVRLGWRAKSETPAEAKARRTAQAAHKARMTRERNKRQKENDDTNVTSFRRAK